MTNTHAALVALLKRAWSLIDTRRREAAALLADIEAALAQPGAGESAEACEHVWHIFTPDLDYCVKCKAQRDAGPLQSARTPEPSAEREAYIRKLRESTDALVARNDGIDGSPRMYPEPSAPDAATEEPTT